MPALGFTRHQHPCAATLPHVLRQLDDSLAEAALGAWGDSDWPALAQGPGERRGTVMQNGAQRAAVGYGVTSLSPEWARPDRLLRGVRQHWQIENQVHGVRAVTCEEDRSQVRCGSMPQGMAAWRNTAIGLMRWVGETHIAAACRRFAAQPWLASALIGSTPENYMALAMKLEAYCEVRFLPGDSTVTASP